MLDKKVKDLINQQVNKEFYSAYLYLDYAEYYAELGLDGFANWYDIQAQEELDHGLLMRTYLQDNGERVVLEAIAKPDQTFDNILDQLKAGLAHEQYVTSLVHEIYNAAFDVRDYRTMQFLDWFVKEQGEEEKNAEGLIKKYELFGSDAKGLYELNQELLSRTYSAPSLTL